MAARDIRITFFYADEGIWDYVKKHKIRDLVVKWADEFYQYHNYNFKIEHSPIPYNERVYKKKFSLSKTKGFVIHNVDLAQLDDEVDKKLKEVTTTQAMRRQLGLVNELSDGDKLLWQTFADAEEKLLAELELLRGKYKDRFERVIRRLINPTITSLNSPKERLPVIFCWFDNQTEVGITPFEASSMFFWTGPPIPGRYPGRFVMIGVNKIVKTNEHVLAHEIGHAAGCVHQDTPKNNLMRPANDDPGKTPTDLIMTPDDLGRLGIASFVR